MPKMILHFYFKFVVSSQAVFLIAPAGSTFLHDLPGKVSSVPLNLLYFIFYNDSYCGKLL